MISTPFVLQIFQPEIQHQIKLMQAAERSAYFQGLPHNPLYLAVQKDQDNVNSLTNKAATGGAAINPATDPSIVGWGEQLTAAENQEQTAFANLQCQLYGTTLPGGRKCIQGNGPLAHDDQQTYEYWKGQVTTLQGEIQQRTETLRGQSAAQQNANKRQAQVQLEAAKLTLTSAQQQLTLQTDGITQNINADNGLLTQLKALGNATAGNSTLAWARFLLFLVFLLIDSMPVFVKLLLNLAPESSYDTLLAAEERQQQRLAEHTRAIRQAAQRKAAQAEASGARPACRLVRRTARDARRYRGGAAKDRAGMAAALGGGSDAPGQHRAGHHARRHRRRPHAVAGQLWRWSVTNNPLRPWPPRNSRPPRPEARSQQGAPAPDESLWGWLGSLRLPRWLRPTRRTRSQWQRWPAPPGATRRRPAESASVFNLTRFDPATNVTLADTRPYGTQGDEDTITQPSWQNGDRPNGSDANIP